MLTMPFLWPTTTTTMKAFHRSSPAVSLFRPCRAACLSLGLPQTQFIITRAVKTFDIDDFGGSTEQQEQQRSSPSLPLLVAAQIELVNFSPETWHGLSHLSYPGGGGGLAVWWIWLLMVGVCEQLVISSSSSSSIWWTRGQREHSKDCATDYNMSFSFGELCRPHTYCPQLLRRSSPTKVSD